MLIPTQLAWRLARLRVRIGGRLIRWLIVRLRFKLRVCSSFPLRAFGLSRGRVGQRLMLACRLILELVFRLRFRLRFGLFFRQRFCRLFPRLFGLELWIFSRLILVIGR